jgi:RNA polymerase sigma factor (sigma-70 family)
MSEDPPACVPGEGLEPALTRLQPRLRRHMADVSRRVNGVDPADLAQEVNARALRYAASFESGRALWPWLRRLAERVVSDQRARGAREEQGHSEVELTADPRVDLREGVDARDTLERGLAVLDELERRALLAFHRDGRSVRQIAQALALPEGTVKSHLHRARRRLAERLERERPDA